MPIQIKYVRGGVGVEFICTGVVTGTDIIEANKEIYSDDRFLKQRYQIIDRTHCADYQVSNDEVEIIVKQDIAAATINPHVIVAFISKTDLQYGVSRMYNSLVGDDGFSSEIFRDRKGAEEWIEKQSGTSKP